jgi:hypothetical protein
MGIILFPKFIKKGQPLAIILKSILAVCLTKLIFLNYSSHEYCPNSHVTPFQVGILILIYVVFVEITNGVTVTTLNLFLDKNVYFSPTSCLAINCLAMFKGTFVTSKPFIVNNVLIPPPPPFEWENPPLQRWYAWGHMITLIQLSIFLGTIISRIPWDNCAFEKNRRKKIDVIMSPHAYEWGIYFFRHNCIREVTIITLIFFLLLFFFFFFFLIEWEKGYKRK